MFIVSGLLEGRARAACQGCWGLTDEELAEMMDETFVVIKKDWGQI